MGDAGKDVLLGSLEVEAGAGVDHAEGVAEGVLAGEDAVLGMEAVGEPVAELGGGDGPSLVCDGSSGDGSPGGAGFGGEWGYEPDGVFVDLFGQGMGHFVHPS